MWKNIYSLRSVLGFVIAVCLCFVWFSFEHNIDMTRSSIESEVPIKVDLRLVVIVYNRVESLKKCLDTLNDAEYLNDLVHIDIWIDRSVTGIIDEPTYKAACDFSFKHGTCQVHNQTKHVGIYGQWIDTWKPDKDSREIAVIIEDDVNVSPFFYRYLKAAHEKYRKYGHINGFALQGMSMKHGGAPGLLNLPAENLVFLYPILGTWGFSPKANNWLAFVEWFKIKSADSQFIPHVPNILPSRWYKANIREHGNINPDMWSMWHISYAYLHNEVTLYKNSPDKKSFTINRKEKGIHYIDGSKQQLDPIVTVWKDSYINFPDQPIFLDINGLVVKDVLSAWNHNKSRR